MKNKMKETQRIIKLEQNSIRVETELEDTEMQL